MAILDIVEWPSAVLETKTHEVKEFDDSLVSLVRDMHETMRAKGGVGLAANQVGDLRRVFVAHIAWSEENDEVKEPWHDKEFTFINPRIISSSGKLKWQEGCLSFPGIYEYIERKAEVVVEAEDVRGKTFTVAGTGLLAVCMQHEIDHLDGIVFLKRMTRLKAAFVRKKIQRRALSEVEEAAVDE